MRRLIKKFMGVMVRLRHTITPEDKNWRVWRPTKMADGCFGAAKWRYNGRMIKKAGRLSGGRPK
jgi:hypothetical protein